MHHIAQIFNPLCSNYMNFVSSSFFCVLHILRHVFPSSPVTYHQLVYISLVSLLHHWLYLSRSSNEGAEEISTSRRKTRITISNESISKKLQLDSQGFSLLGYISNRAFYCSTHILFIYYLGSDNAAGFLVALRQKIMRISCVFRFFFYQGYIDRHKFVDENQKENGSELKQNNGITQSEFRSSSLSLSFFVAHS